jgi:D-glycero-D-manno-heptose 1,7-bisphosphate phosphatase
MVSILMDTRMPIKTIFLDRDGVINKEVAYLYKINDFIFIKGIFNACQYFQKKGYEIVIITNQSGIERGLYTKDDYEIITNWMLRQFIKQGISILDVFHCPHSPHSNCKCRKPKPGMIKDASEKHNIDLTQSWVIGDKESDIEAANAAGISKTILVRSGHKVDESNSNANYILNSIHDCKSIINH